MPQDKSRPGRTPIWVEGRQHPRFEPRSFARACLIFGRDSMAALLARCSLSAQGFGAEVAAGRWRLPEARLGRSGRWLPDHRRVAAALAGAGRLLGRTAEVLLPGAGPALPEPVSDADGPGDAPPPETAEARGNRLPALTLVAADRLAAPTGPAAEPPDASLAAIRLVIGAEPARRIQGATPPIRQPQPEPLPEADLAPPRPPGRLGAWLGEAAARGLGYGLLAMSLPWGALRATMAHLNGEDLRKLEA